jgi:ribonuclease E
VPAAAEGVEQVEVGAEAPVEVVVTKRTRKPARTRVEKAEKAEAPELVTEEVPAPVSEQEQAEAPVTEQEEQPAPVSDQDEVAAPVAAPVVAAPTVVTRTRRSASRPAGTPVRTTPEPIEPIQVPVTPATDGSGPQSAQPSTEAPAEPPKVVTRTRGRSASRPAGPPEGSGADGVPTGDGSDGDAPVVEHVPVKKKGARKR